MMPKRFSIARRHTEENTVSWARRWLSLYATAFAIVVVLAIGIFLVVENGDIESPEARFGLGLNLIASALFALVFASCATWVLERNQRDTLEEILHRQNSEVLARIGQFHLRYMPIAEYPALDTFGEAFNRALMASIDGSQIYDFYGPSARYVAARLRMVPRCPAVVRVGMIDPGLSSSVMRRAADREKWLSSSGLSLPEIERRFRSELEMTIVSLFDFRTSCPVHIVYTNDTVVYRVELTDDAVFFSWYHGPQSAGKEIPESVQFGADALYYQVLRQEMTRRFEVSPRTVSFDSKATDADLLSHLAELTSKNFTAADLTRMRAEYDTYGKGLRDFLQKLGY
jgi:uncharacterized membrane protein YfbV (UPF0208 family)